MCRLTADPELRSSQSGNERLLPPTSPFNTLGKRRSGAERWEGRRATHPTVVRLGRRGRGRRVRRKRGPAPSGTKGSARKASTAGAWRFAQYTDAQGNKRGVPRKINAGPASQFLDPQAPEGVAGNVKRAAAQAPPARGPAAGSPAQDFAAPRAAGGYDDEDIPF